MVAVTCGSVFAACAATRPELTRQKLTQETQIQGHACAAGYAWFYPDGHLQQCAVPRDMEFGEARIPAGTWINLTDDGRPDYVFLAHDTEIAGYLCEGGNRVLGPREGAMTGFYPSGRLKYCWLASDRDVQGVPCSRSGMFTGNSSLEFFESGRLRECKLSRDYGGMRAGQRYAQSR